MASPTRADLETLIAGYEAIARRDIDAIISVVAADAVLETRLGTYRGHEELRRYFEESVPNDMTSEVEALLLTEDRIVVLSEVSMVGPSSQIAGQRKGR